MDIEVDGISVQVDTEGAGPPLVLVHSLLTDASGFDIVAPRWAEHRTVHRVSLPGFGASAPLEFGGAPSIEALADHVAAVLDQLGCGSDTAILGNGLGSFIVVALAARHGNRFGRVIAANTGATFPEDRRPAFEAMAGLVEEGGMEAVVDVAIKRVFPQSFMDAHPNIVAERREAMTRTHPQAFADACRGLAVLDLGPVLADIKNPTLVIGGGADQTTPPHMARELAAGITDSELLLLDGCGHCPQLERPDDLIDGVERFLAA